MWVFMFALLMKLNPVHTSSIEQNKDRRIVQHLFRRQNDLGCVIMKPLQDVAAVAAELAMTDVENAENVAREAILAADDDEDDDDAEDNEDEDLDSDSGNLHQLFTTTVGKKLKPTMPWHNEQ